MKFDLYLTSKPKSVYLGTLKSCTALNYFITTFILSLLIIIHHVYKYSISKVM